MPMSVKLSAIFHVAVALGCLAGLRGASAEKAAVAAPAPLVSINSPGWRHEELRRFPAPEARQGVAVDNEFLYAISNHDLAKYRKSNAEKVAVWNGPDNGPITHLNAGIVRDGRLYCAHSNYPHIPMLSSVEIWDTATLTHVGTHSFGRMDGSLTWIDWRDGKWFACFAHYGKEKAEAGRDPSWTQIIAFDEQWRRLESWALPPALVERLSPRGYTCSGGAFGPGGYLYVTGHDNTELYVLQFPEAGSTMKWIATVAITAEGQSFAWDSQEKNVLYTIVKRSREVIISRIHTPSFPGPAGAR